MARSAGLRTIPLPRVRAILEKNREGTHDIYCPLSSIQLDLRASLAPLADRFHARVAHGGRKFTLRLSPTAIRQISAIAGIPTPFLGKAPASVGLGLLRSMLRLAIEAQDRELLLRLRGKRLPRLRAVLPSSHVRFDDLDVLTEIESALGDSGHEFKVVNLNVNEDLFCVRGLLNDPLDLGTLPRKDPAASGIDIVSSETGRPLELRHVLVRIVCSNGMTSVLRNGGEKTRHTSMDRAAFRARAAQAIDRALERGREMSAQLAEFRSAFVKLPRSEVETILRRYQLGSVRGRVGQWVMSELERDSSLFGVSRFEIVQAFTAVARGLQPINRRRLEDAMGDYVGDLSIPRTPAGAESAGASGWIGSAA